MFGTRLCNASHSFLSISHLVSDLIRKFRCITSHDEIFKISLFLEDSLTQVAPFYRESALRTLQNAHSCREEVPHDEGQLFASYPKKFSLVSLIDRALQLHFSTLEKTQIHHNPLVNNLILTFPQVSTFDRHLEQSVQDLDIHTVRRR